MNSTDLQASLYRAALRRTPRRWCSPVFRTARLMASRSASLPLTRMLPALALAARMRGEPLMDADMHELMEAIRDAMTLPPGDKRNDATDCVYAVLHVLLGDEPPSVTSQARWLREELSAIQAGGGTGVLARRTIAEQIIEIQPAIRSPEYLATLQRQREDG